MIDKPKFISLRFPDSGLLERLDKTHSYLGETRSEFIRVAVAERLEKLGIPDELLIPQPDQEALRRRQKMARLRNRYARNGAGI